jgi:hypothetical protein
LKAHQEEKIDLEEIFIPLVWATLTTMEMDIDTENDTTAEILKRYRDKYNEIFPLLQHLEMNDKERNRLRVLFPPIITIRDNIITKWGKLIDFHVEMNSKYQLNSIKY